MDKQIIFSFKIRTELKELLSPIHIQIIGLGMNSFSKTQIYSQSMLGKYPEFKAPVLVQLCSDYMFN